MPPRPWTIAEIGLAAGGVSVALLLLAWLLLSGTDHRVSLAVDRIGGPGLIDTPR